MALVGTAHLFKKNKKLSKKYIYLFNSTFVLLFETLGLRVTSSDQEKAMADKQIVSLEGCRVASTDSENSVEVQVPTPACNGFGKTGIGSSGERGKPKAETDDHLEVPNDKAYAGGPLILNPFEFNAPPAAARGLEHFVLPVPKENIVLITGMGGETIKNMQIRSGATIELTRPKPSDGEQSKEWIVTITGTMKQILSARAMINDVLSQTVTQSPIPSGNNQEQGHRPCGLVAPHWRSRGGPHHSQSSCYKYPQRAPYPSLNSQHPPLSNGNYPLLVAPRSHAPKEAPAPSGPAQQTHPNPPYGSAPASGGHGHTYPDNPSAAASSGNGQPVAGQGQQPQAYPLAGPTGGYGLYSAPHPAANNAAAYEWYNTPVNPAAIVPQEGPPAAYWWYKAPINPIAIGAPSEQGPPAAYGWYKAPVNPTTIGAPYGLPAAYEWYQVRANRAAIGAPPQQGPPAAYGWYTPVNPAAIGAPPQQCPVAAAQAHHPGVAAVAPVVGYGGCCAHQHC